MKTFILISLFVSSLLLSAKAGEVEHVYYFGNPGVKNSGEYQQLNFENTLLTALSGQPVMPYQAVKLMLPPGESAQSIEIVFSDETILQGTFRISPQQEVRPVSAGASGGFSKDEEIYCRNATYPANPNGQLITSYMNGRSFALSSFTPMRYNPVTGKVSWFTSAKVTVHSVGDVKAQAALSNLAVTNKQAVRFADNTGMDLLYKTSRQPSTGVSGYELLIITTSAFATSFESLRAAYLKEGLQSQVVTLETINSSMSGIDQPEKMRNYIIQEYQSSSIQHVILAGDADILPFRGFYAYVQSGSGYSDSGIPSDLYFSALDGIWNADGDALWGEPGEEDLLPDLSVGRMPFSNLAELNSMIHKSYSYQFTPVATEFRDVLLAGEYLYGPPYLTYGSYYLELLIGTRTNNGYTTYGIPDAYPVDKLYDETASWSKQTLMAHLNSGRPMFHHVGHANYTVMMRMDMSDITNLNFSGLNGTDHNYTVAYTHGCNCGGFDMNDCIAEKTVTIDNFAAAIIANSRFGWFNEGTDEGPSTHMNREFVDALFHDKLNRIGRAHMESKIATSPWVTAPGQWEPGALRWCFYDCNLLGDPAMAVFTDNPFDILTSYPANITTGASSMPVSVTSGGLPVEGLSCVVLENGALIGKATTDVAGNATVYFDPAIVNPDNVQLVVSGYNCIPVTYNLTARTYTWNVASGTWKTPGSWLPARTSPAANDVLVFDGSIQAAPSVTLDFKPAESAGRLRFINNVAVTIAASPSAVRITSGASGSLAPQFEIAAGSSLAVDAVNAVTLNLPTGSVAGISGDIVFSHAAHRLTADGTNGITFNGGSSFTAGSDFTGTAFGNVTPNSVVFTNGSRYNHEGGTNPFALASPGSVVVFNAGSLYKFTTAAGSPDLSGRTYGNLEISSASPALSSMSGTGSLAVGNLKISSGICGFNLSGGMSISGDLVVLPGASVDFAPETQAAVSLNGAAPQAISGGGTIKTGVNCVLNISNGAGINIGSAITVSGTLSLTNGLLNLGNSNLTLDANATIGGNPSESNMIVATGSGELRKSFAATGSFTFPTGDNTGTAEYSPVTLTFTSGTFDADAYSGVSLANAPASGLVSSYLNRYWTVTSAGINSFACDAQFSYIPADVSGNEADIQCVQMLPPHFYIHNPANTTLHSLAASGISSFGIFTGESIDTEKTLNLTSVFPEGLYESNGILRQAYDESGPHWPAGVADHITVELHNASDYGTVAYTSGDVALSTSGSAVLMIPATFHGSYFITIRHRNSLQVVSSTAVSFTGGTITRSFGTPADVYGGKLRLMSDLGYAMYGGDINQDNSINDTDAILVDSDAALFSKGYLPGDCNGDGVVDAADLIIVDNNSSLFVTAETP